MIRYRLLQLLFLISSMTPKVIGMLPAEKAVSSLSSPIQEIGEGIAQRIEELPKELRYNIFSSALKLQESPKYEVYKKLNTGYSLTGIALNDNNKRVLTGSSDRVARIWDIEEGKLLKELKGHTNIIESVALSSDGSRALTGSWDETARIWDTNTGELIIILKVGSPISSVALSSDGSSALIGDYDARVRLYNTSTGEFKEFKGHTDTIKSVALSADGIIALTGSDDGTVRAWNTITKELMSIFQVGSPIISVALSADGTIALGATRKRIFVWNVKTGNLLNTLLMDEDSILSVALSKDGKRALTSTDTTTIQVWNTKPLPGKKETKTPLTVLVGHTAPVKALAFGDADLIASGSDNGSLIIWKRIALKHNGPEEYKDVLREAYKETFSRPLLRSANGK